MQIRLNSVGKESLFWLPAEDLNEFKSKYNGASFEST